MPSRSRATSLIAIDQRAKTLRYRLADIEARGQQWGTEIGFVDESKESPVEHEEHKKAFESIQAEYNQLSNDVGNNPGSDLHRLPHQVQQGEPGLLEEERQTKFAEEPNAEHLGFGSPSTPAPAETVELISSRSTRSAIWELLDDIRIIGSASSGLSSEDIGITIVSLAPRDSQVTILPMGTVDDERHLNAARGETTPSPAVGPTIQAFSSLPRRHDGNGS
ncbi:hypothetical protein EHS25_005736 [Saitozyma podzolica]|uniref:Uncharacterized protein n=1 Tax=Saitozyma podzolica TaxID=1890683 RepID=A0A427XVT8_9TREE|nr:hypothetical protein EHS25_005736 [Saitozyma podzolica]